MCVGCQAGSVPAAAAAAAAAGSLPFLLAGLYPTAAAAAHSQQPAVKKLLEENQLPHLLFYGPPGTGKTSTILAIARQIYGPSAANMTLELNASGACCAARCGVQR